MIGSSDDSLRRGVFATNRGRPVHRWYEFAEAYSAALVREQLTSLAPGSLAVFDPFAGSGTTVLEASRMGFSCYYSEVNPFLSWLTIVKARDALLIATDGTRPQLEALSKRIERGRLPSKTRSDDKYHPLLIADAKREYFPAGVAAGVVLLLNWINKNLDGSACELAKLSVLTSLISSSNMVRRTDLRRRRITDAKPLSLRETILRRIKQILKDTEDISLPHRIHTMSLGSDVRELCTRSVHVDLTITSPPYLNGTNYCRNTKLELLAGNFIQSEADLGQLRSDGIQAGINGVAKTRIRPSDVPSSVRELCERLQKCAYDSRIPKLVEGYFSDMKRALEVIRRLTYEGGRLILDIGDSKFAGVHVPTNLILTEIAEAVGWRLVGSEKLRSRTSYDGSPLIQVCLELKAV